MSLNVGKVHDLVELYVGKAGADSTQRVNPVLVRELINVKLRDFVARSGCLESTWTINSVASTQEYELPTTTLHVREVVYDDYRAYKLIHEQVNEKKGRLS